VLVLAVVGAALLWAPAARGGDEWNRAIAVPGLAALNTARNASVQGISCRSPGNCSAGGNYSTPKENSVFLVDETNGVWGRAFEVPGLASMRGHGGAVFFAISCGAVGNCSVVGQDGSRAFVVDEVRGTWGDAQAVGPLPRKGQSVYLTAVSCSSAGNCGAAGDDSFDHGQGFALSERKGTWRHSVTLHGFDRLHGVSVSVNAISCAASGDCGIAGSYAVSTTNDAGQAFVADETDGTWANVIEDPGTARLNYDGNADTFSISCPSAGNCSAGGMYTDDYSHSQAFVENEVDGKWETAIEVPGTGRLDTGGFGAVYALSCASSGNCGAEGEFGAKIGLFTFVADEVDGTWQYAIEVPGLTALKAVSGAGVGGISCVSVGNCTVGNNYTNNQGLAQAFVASEARGVWGDAIQVPGLNALASDSSGLAVISCATADSCSVGGLFSLPLPKNEAQGINLSEGFVASTRSGSSSPNRLRSSLR
jgi:hypothetical protein